MKEKTLNFFKKYYLDIIFLILFIALCFIIFVPFATIPTLDGSERVVYLFDCILGCSVNIDGTTYSLMNSGIIFIIALASYFISLATFGVGFYFQNLKNNKKISTILYVFSIILLGITTIIYALGGLLIPIATGMPIGDENTGSTTTEFGAYLLSCSIIMMFILLSKTLDENKYSIKELCETAILVAIAVVLDQFAKIQMQGNGGSISISPVPLFIIGIRYGGLKGFIASSFYFGFITCLADGYGIQTYPFDYLVALSGYGFVGFFFNLFQKIRSKKETKLNKIIFSNISSLIVAGVLVMIVRYVGHMISGYILYPTMSLLENFLYQTSYVPLTALISTVIMICLLEPVMYINKLYPVKRNIVKIGEEENIETVTNE